MLPINRSEAGVREAAMLATEVAAEAVMSAMHQSPREDPRLVRANMLRNRWELSNSQATISTLP